MMPFLHDGDGSSVTITPTNGDYQQQRVKSESSRFSGHVPAKLHRILQRHSVSAVPSAVDIQRKAAHRKLQMAKMMGNGGGNLVMDFRKQQQNNQGHQMMMDPHNDPMYVASRRARSNNFTLKETFDLLKIWASPEMQWQMKHNFRNFRVWEAISYAMQELGHDRTAIQCKNRIQNLTSIFYRIKKSKQDYRSFNFPYYKIIGDVLDGKKNGTNASMPPNMAEFIQHFTNNGSGLSVSPTHSAGASGIAAHMALVEEYQHLINGNPEVTLTPTGDRNHSSNGTSGMNVLSPEVSISEGDSPIRMDSQTRSTPTPNSQTSQSSSTAQKNHGSSNASTSSFTNRNGNASVSIMKVEQHNDNDGMMNGGMDDGSLVSENDHEASDFDESNMYNAEEEIMLGNGGYPGGRVKRSMSAGYSSFGKAGFSSLTNGIPTKRPRGLSSATTASTSALEDPIGQYLSEMVDIERQWLDMERERAENERQMMMYMMQILQALVCPGQEGQEEETEEEETVEGQANEEDGEAVEHEYVEHENDENEIRQMIEQEEEQTMEEDVQNE